MFKPGMSTCCPEIVFNNNDDRNKGGALARSHCMRGNTCVHLGGLRLNCALPDAVAGGFTMGSLHMCISKSGL